MLQRCALVGVLALLHTIVVPAQIARPGPTPGQGGGPGQRTPPRSVGAPTDQATPVGTAVIRGAVVALESGAPIRRAQVRAYSVGGRDSRMATTDGQGRFELRDLPAGRYSLSASKSGMVTLQYGQRRPGQSGTPIEVRDKQILDKVTIGLPRGSVIAGRITDELGEPIAQANVMAMQSRFVRGLRQLVPAGPGGRTDDLGQFRLYGLSPGDYTVSATCQVMGMETDSSPEATGFAPTYFPGVPSASEAQRITVAVGEENTSASFALVATRLVTVEGTVVSGQGGAVTAGMVMLMPSDASGQSPMMFMGGAHSGRIEQSGRFKITNVAPGRYIAQARVTGRENGEIGRVLLTVGSDKSKMSAS